jgi:hypothetical protein
MGVSNYFSDCYEAARAKFREAARAAGATVETHVNPSTGPEGEVRDWLALPAANGDADLATDVIWIGPRDAERLLLTVSGTHGAEGFCGSGIQVGWLESGLCRELPRGTAMLMVHALNPHGFAWLRRVNEGNVDLNRNFIDHTLPYPINEGYETLKDAICPAEWTEESLAAARERLDAYGQAHGAMALQGAISTGQYSDPRGVFYGGTAPSWSNRTLDSVLRRHAGHARHVAYIDLHTGLGPHGYGEIISNHATGSGGHARVVDWYGDEATNGDDGSSSSAAVMGDTTVGVERALPAAAVAGITLEYGTVPLDEVLTAVRADNWVHLHGDLAAPLGRELKARMRRAFYADTDEWKAMIWERAVDVHRRALKGLTGS